MLFSAVSQTIILDCYTDHDRSAVIRQLVKSAPGWLSSFLAAGICAD